MAFPTLEASASCWKLGRWLEIDRFIHDEGHVIKSFRETMHVVHGMSLVSQDTPLETSSIAFSRIADVSASAKS